MSCCRFWPPKPSVSQAQAAGSEVRSSRQGGRSICATACLRQKLQQAGAALEEARLLLRWEGGERLLCSCSLPALAEYVGCFTAFYWYITAVMGKSDASARSYSRCLAGLCGKGNRSLEHVASSEFHAYVRCLPRNSASGSLLSATVRHFIEFRRHCTSPLSGGLGEHS
mmetsp:Transcript_57676/g.134356  ORF Transcript_57676/g.134356 Transcript_57676/m.134356 type:complete len:169 (+) Transcript_57676:158-664(+)